MKTLLAISCFLTTALMAEQPMQCCRISKQCCPETFNPCGLTYGFYGEFLYLQPNGTDLFYGATAVGISPTSSGDGFSLASIASPDWTVLEIQPDYHSGFEVGVKLASNNNHITINLNWERLHAVDSNSYSASADIGHMVGPFFDIGPNSAAYKIATGKATSHFDAVNLTFGKNLCFFNNFHTELYGAAAFARIKQTLLSTYSNFSGSISRAVETDSTFTGAGPQVGLNYDYRIHSGFFFSGNSTLSLLVGQMKNATTYQSVTPELATIGLSSPNNQATTIPNRTQLVPAFEQKLGFSWISTWKSTQATFAFGYQCQLYLDAIQVFNMASQAIPTDLVDVSPDVAVYAVAFEQTNSNFILSGPYVFLGFEF
ncbi:MAG TPA: Lpg1974 family pore-forming outer membrane protein [Chlamydiales bacterium]|jgi:hypothetical protein|nr:Lpg1974 family pore-forming outer membrane protein [Chlamydiales bacterium]